MDLVSLRIKDGETIATALTDKAVTSGGSRNSGRGGSKIKFMKGVGVGGGVPPPVAGPGAQPQPLF